MPVGSSNFDRYQRIAPLYDLIDFPFEYTRYRRIRPMLFQGLSGRVLDAGVGTGRNFPFYPPARAREGKEKLLQSLPDGQGVLGVVLYVEGARQAACTWACEMRKH